MMWSTIGLTTARQLGVAGRLIVARRLPRTTTVMPSGIRVAAIFGRGFAEARTRTRKSSKTATGTASKSAAKKKPAAKKAAGKKPAKKASTKKAALTAEEKTQLKIKELKKRALLKEIHRLPSTAWSVYVSQHFREQQAGNTKADPSVFGPTITRLAREFKELSTEERAKLDDIARQNKVTNETAYKNWIESHTPQEIHDANYARSVLRRSFKIPARHQIPDSRFPKKPLNPYASYVKSRIHSPDLANLPPRDRLASIGKEWKSLSDAEKQPHIEVGITDLDRYVKAKHALLGAADKGKQTEARA
ncbi:hypothetical protein VTK56DRAFT_1616 [Thermocarpiscus australiensis]